MVLWESAGVKLKEAALTADQIQSLFAEIETQSTASGGNRTLLGKGKDAAEAVNKAWEDLKTKIQDSGPIKAVDQKYDDVVAKIEAGLGGPDNAINTVIQKYRTFAKEHPIAQGLIYSALIAAAGISGAGLGGAAVLGLLKMTDKLLQGEKFSSAAYAGGKTGAMAYGASKLGDYLKGKPEGGGEVPADIQQGLAADQAFQDRILNKFPPDKGYTFSSSGDSLQVFDSTGRKVFTGDIPLKTMDMKTFADLTNNGQMATPGISSGSVSSDAMAGVRDAAKSDAAFKAMGDAQDLRGQLQLPTADAAENAKATAKAAAEFVAADPAEKAEIIKTTGLTAKELTKAAANSAADVATSQPYGAGMSSDYLQRVVDAGGNSGVRFKISPEDAQKALDWQAQNSGQAAGAAADAATSAGKAAGKYSADYLQQVIDGTHPRPMINKDRAAELLKAMKGESISRTSKSLSEGQVYMVFNRVCTLNDKMLGEGRLMEGPLDAIKGAAGKAMNWAATKGKNLTTKVTADKLNSAWQKAGAPTDSEELKAFLTQQGVAANVVDGVYKTMKIASSPKAADAAAPMDIEQVKKLIAALPVDRKVRLLKYLEKNSGGAPAAAAPSRDAGNGRIEPTMA